MKILLQNYLIPFNVVYQKKLDMLHIAGSNHAVVDVTYKQIAELKEKAKNYHKKAMNHDEGA